MITFLWFQTVKGGISETRIEKRIVITGDADIDHDQVGMLRRFWAWERSLVRKMDCMQKTPLPASSPKSPLFCSSSYSGRRTKEIRLYRLVGLGPLVGEASRIEGT